MNKDAREAVRQHIRKLLKQLKVELNTSSSCLTKGSPRGNLGVDNKKRSK